MLRWAAHQLGAAASPFPAPWTCRVTGPPGYGFEGFPTGWTRTQVSNIANVTVLDCFDRIAQALKTTRDHQIEDAAQTGLRCSGAIQVRCPHPVRTRAPVRLRLQQHVILDQALLGHLTSTHRCATKPAPSYPRSIHRSPTVNCTSASNPAMPSVAGRLSSAFRGGRAGTRMTLSQMIRGASDCGRRFPVQAP